MWKLILIFLMLPKYFFLLPTQYSEKGSLLAHLSKIQVHTFEQWDKLQCDRGISWLHIHGCMLSHLVT